MKYEILKQTTMSGYQYKTRKQTVKLGRKLEISYARNRLFDLKTRNETTSQKQHHNNEVNNYKKLNHIKKL